MNKYTKGDAYPTTDITDIIHRVIYTVIYALRKFRNFVFAAPVTVYSDHNFFRCSLSGSSFSFVNDDEFYVRVVLGSIYGGSLCPSSNCCLSVNYIWTDFARFLRPGLNLKVRSNSCNASDQPLSLAHNH